MTDLICGSFCVKHILEKLGKEDITVDPNMLWISELVLFLNKHISNKLNLYYYNSSLMKDYYLTQDNNFDGFKHIKSVIDSKKIDFIEKELTLSELENEINNSKFIILCVESKVLNNDASMNGGHYVVLEKNSDNKLIMYNPQKSVMATEIIDHNRVIELCINYGSWRVVIEKEGIEND